MSRSRTRFLTSSAICALGCVLVAFGAALSWNFTPLNVLGYPLAILGALGMLGTNIFWGGPLDKRLDRDTALSPIAREELDAQVARQGEAGRRLVRVLFAIPPIGAVIVLALVMLEIL